MVDAVFISDKYLVEYDNVLLITRNRDSISIKLFRGVDFEIFNTEAVLFVEGYLKYIGKKYTEIGYSIPELEIRYEAL